VDIGRRFLAYGVAGWVFEVVFTGAKAPFRDRNMRLTSHTYLWMFPIYGAGGLAHEGLRTLVRDRPAWQRGVAYAGSSYVIEATSGELLRRITGEVPWDYARSRRVDGKVPANWRGLVRPAYAPVWFATGLAFERMQDALFGVLRGQDGSRGLPKR
jgi:uncharacterized membrane protein